MRLGIDGREIQDGVHTGIGRALHDFLLYCEKFTEEELVIFSSRPLPASLGLHSRNCVMRERLAFWWDQCQLPWAIRREGVEVFYSPYYKIPFTASCPKASAVLDLINLLFEGYRRELTLVQKLFYKTIFPLHLRASSRIVTCSRHALADLEKTYAAIAGKICTVPLTVSDCFQPADAQERMMVRERFGINGPYIVYVGNFKAHKNVGTLLEAFAILADEFPGLTLVLVAPMAQGYQDLLRQCHRYKIDQRVLFTGKVTDARQVRALYAEAEAAVVPSLYEGFGLPPLEAMACGTPVVCARATSLPEVVADAAALVDPLSARDMAKALRWLLQDEGARRILVGKGLRQAEKFRPKAVCPKLLDVLRQLKG